MNGIPLTGEAATPPAPTDLVQLGGIADLLRASGRPDLAGIVLNAFSELVDHRADVRLEPVDGGNVPRDDRNLSNRYWKAYRNAEGDVSARRAAANQYLYRTGRADVYAELAARSAS